MEYNEINFNKQNRRPVTDTTYQIAAEEWNALGNEVDRQRQRLEEINVDGVEWMTNMDILRILNN